MTDGAAQTATLDRELEGTEQPHAWWISIAYHSTPAYIGRRVQLASDQDFTLGRRRDQLGAGALDDAHISRDHARVTFGPQGTPTLFDLGSHNGSFVNGGKVSEHRLIAGDVIGIGSLLLLVECEPQPATAPVTEGVVGTSYGMSTALCSLEKAASRTTSVLLIGETGTGKDTLARVLHERTRHGAAWVALRCGALPGEDPREAVAGALKNARGGTLYLDGIEDLPQPAQLRLLDALDAAHRDAAHRDAARIVASSSSMPSRSVTAGRLRAEFATRIQRWTIRLPTLRERRADIPLLAAEFARRLHKGEPPGFTPELMFRLLRHRWPGNVRELEAIVERAAVETEDGPIDTFETLDALLAEPHSTKAISTLGRGGGGEGFVLQAEGHWFSTPQGTRHDLGRRKTLTRLFGVLIEHRRSKPGKAIGVDELLARAWPHEKLSRRAGANRVYVAVTTLRKMGLRELIARTEAGYLLDPDVAWRIIDE